MNCMTNGQWETFLRNVAGRIILHPERLGQAYFNELSLLHPEIGETYRGTALDPFYHDNRVAAFLLDIYSNYVR